MGKVMKTEKLDTVVDLGDLLEVVKDCIGSYARQLNRHD